MWLREDEKTMKDHEEEFKALIKIVPTDDLTAIRIAATIELYRERFPVSYFRVMEAKP